MYLNDNIRLIEDDDIDMMTVRCTMKDLAVICNY